MITVTFKAQFRDKISSSIFWEMIRTEAGDKQQLSAIILFFCHSTEEWFSPLTFASHKGDGEAESTGGNTSEHETQLHLFSQTWNIPLVLFPRVGPSWQYIILRLPLSHSPQTLSHCQGFGTRISVHLEVCMLVFSVACDGWWNV